MYPLYRITSSRLEINGNLYFGGEEGLMYPLCNITLHQFYNLNRNTYFISIYCTSIIIIARCMECDGVSFETLHPRGWVC